MGLAPEGDATREGGFCHESPLERPEALLEQQEGSQPSSC